MSISASEAAAIAQGIRDAESACRSDQPILKARLHRGAHAIEQLLPVLRHSERLLTVVAAAYVDARAELEAHRVGFGADHWVTLRAQDRMDKATALLRAVADLQPTSALRVVT